MPTHDEWAAEVAKQLRLRKWNMKMLAAETGYSHSHIRQVMCGFVKSQTARLVINQTLGINE